MGKSLSLSLALSLSQHTHIHKESEGPQMIEIYWTSCTEKYNATKLREEKTEKKEGRERERKRKRAREGTE
jgi:hypothetical protein